MVEHNEDPEEFALQKKFTESFYRQDKVNQIKKEQFDLRERINRQVGV